MLIVPQVDLVTSRRCHGRSPLSGPSAACLKTSCQRNQGTVPGHVWVNVARIRTSGKSMEKFGQSMDTYGKVWKNGIVRWVSIHSTPYLSLLSIIYPQKKMNISPLICFFMCYVWYNMTIHRFIFRGHVHVMFPPVQHISSIQTPVNGLVEGKILTGNHGFYHQI